MKRIIFLALMIVTISCEPVISDDFIIVNNCEEDINVNIISYGNITHDFIVKAKKDSLFITMGGIGPLRIESAYKQITVTKNGEISQENYVNQAKWEEIKVNKAHYKWYLHVNPEDFEE